MNHKTPHTKMPADEFGQLRAFLALQGVSQADIKAAIGTITAGRSRAEIAQALRIWLKQRPKA